jgi:hypothetical protein
VSTPSNLFKYSTVVPISCALSGYWLELYLPPTYWDPAMSVSTGVKQLKKAARIILVGAPGVGKGTQSERLIKRYPQLASIATGDLLRDNVKNNTPLGT